MTQKPKIQYIGQFYVHGSEAKALAEKEKKKARTKLPIAKEAPVAEITVEPMALGSIVVAVVLLVALAAGALGLHTAWQEYTVMSNYVDRLTLENVTLMEQYRSSYNLDDIESHALTLGLVPGDQVKQISIRLTPPAPEVEETLWDDIVWFFEGLFA